jgi:hypothetical protein
MMNASSDLNAFEELRFKSRQDRRKIPLSEASKKFVNDEKLLRVAS